ncbi:hypothetical protein HELRODRAFT_188502, partial [Helobdella robusta]|uniref:GPR180-like N-terminal domain-containing protein n=1 Tax=Helobdella robusta TaxID=6412 RepID=T1FQ22_HELRO
MKAGCLISHVRAIDREANNNYISNTISNNNNNNIIKNDIKHELRDNNNILNHDNDINLADHTDEPTNHFISLQQIDWKNKQANNFSDIFEENKKLERRSKPYLSSKKSLLKQYYQMRFKKKSYNSNISSPTHSPNEYISSINSHSKKPSAQKHFIKMFQLHGRRESSSSSSSSSSPVFSTSSQASNLFIPTPPSLSLKSSSTSSFPLEPPSSLIASRHRRMRHCRNVRKKFPMTPSSSLSASSSSSSLSSSTNDNEASDDADDEMNYQNDEHHKQYINSQPQSLPLLSPSSSSFYSLDNDLESPEVCVFSGRVSTKENWFGYLANLTIAGGYGSLEFEFSYLEERCCINVLFYYEDQLAAMGSNSNCWSKEYILRHEDDQILRLTPNFSWSGCQLKKRFNQPNLIICKGGRSFSSIAPSNLNYRRSDENKNANNFNDNFNDYGHSDESHHNHVKPRNSATWYVALSNCGSLHGLELNYRLKVYGHTIPCPSENISHPTANSGNKNYKTNKDNDANSAPVSSVSSSSSSSSYQPRRPLDAAQTHVSVSDWPVCT